MASYDDTATVSGSIVRVNDGADSVPLKNWLVTFPASLDGYTEVHGTKNTGTGTPETQYTVSLGRTIYGGTADVVNGTGTDGYGYIVFDGSNDENWGGYSAYNGYYIDISDMKSGTRQDGVCNQLTCSKSTAQGQTDAFWLGAGNKRFYVIGVYDSMGNTLEAFRAYLANNPLILVYPLATHADFTFTPITPTPETPLGVSNFWSDQGNVEVTYYKAGYGFTSVTVHKETPDGEPIEETRKLHRIIYEGQVDVINGTGLIYRGESGTQYDPPEQISFTPIEVSTDEGENTLYADEGNSAIVYRKEST